MTLHCHRCGAFVAAEVVHLEDGPEGIYIVTQEPVASHVHECRCGTDFVVVSTQRDTECLGQMRMAS